MACCQRDGSIPAGPRAGLHLLLLALLAGCSSGEQATGELLIYAGLAPPTWSIRGDALQGVPDRLVGLRPIPPPADFPRFGILGVSLQNGDSLPGLPDWVVISGGVVQTISGTTISYFQDDRDLGTHLVQSALSAGLFPRSAP